MGSYLEGGGGVVVEILEFGGELVTAVPHAPDLVQPEDNR